MTAVEIVLIIVGVIMMVGSFFVSEKLSQREIKQISELSSEEMKRILAINMENAEKKVEILVDDVIDKSMDIVERALNKETNMKIQAISEYSETVLESIHKSHNEVMFLYNMLNEKHTELTEHVGTLQKMKNELERLEEDVVITLANSEDIMIQLSEKNVEAVIREQNSEDKSVEKPNAKDTAAPEVADQMPNNNRRVLEMYREGIDVVEIAKQLGLGLGEVRLVIDLYKEDEA